MGELKEADDLVRFRMVDSYLGLYKKTELLLSWALLHTDAQYFAKVDDDVYLNYHALWTFVDSTWGPSPYGVYTGNFHRFEPIRRRAVSGTSATTSGPPNARTHHTPMAGRTSCRGMSCSAPAPCCARRPS